MRERDPDEVIEALQSYGISTAQLDPVPSVALGILEVIEEQESRLAKLEAVADAAAYMHAAFDVMVSVRTEPKRLENARAVFAEKRREFRAAVAVLDKEPTNG